MASAGKLPLEMLGFSAVPPDLPTDGDTGASLLGILGW